MKQTLTTPSPSTRNLSRRAFGAGALGLGLVSALPAQAMTVKDAEALIQRVLGDVLSIINAGKSQAAVLRDFEGIFQRYGDRTRIASAILGQPWRAASGAERNAYVDALSGYLARKYGKQFADFKGASIEISRSTDYGRKGIIVQSLVETKKWSEPFPVEWHVINSDGQLKFFDIIIEGVKLLSAERNEIRAILDRNGGSVAALTAALTKMG
jgi:phospholipid transport system substrate-binding protein